MKELLDNLILEKDIVEQLIEIDNDKMNTKLSFQNYYDAIKFLLDKDSKELLLNNNSLFITEGNPLVTLDILRSVMRTSYNVVIFINQGYVGMNKWLINQFYKIVGNGNIELDTGINYNNYINSEYKVIPVGEEGLTSQVMEDFYGE